MSRTPEERPAGITALAVFFAAGALVSATSCASLLTPGGPLEPMWRVNPRAHLAFARMGLWAPLLLSVLCVACTLAARGLWRGALWGYRLSVGILAVHLVGDALNVALGIEPRALIGIPIVAAILAFLATGRVRRFFRSPRSD